MNPRTAHRYSSITTTSTTLLGRSRQVLGAALLILGVACSTAPPPPEQHQEDQAKALATSLPPSALDSAACANHALGRCMLDSLTAQFAAQFCTGTVAKCNALTRPNLQLDAVAFMDTVKSVIVAPGSIRGVWMEYGLNQDLSFTAGFRVVEMTPDSTGAYAYDTTGTAFRTPDANGRLQVSNYPAFVSSAAQRYLTKVLVRRTVGGGPTPLDPVTRNDRTSYLLPWECVLESMYVDNATAVANGAKLVVGSISRPLKVASDPSDDMRHLLALYLFDKNPLVDDVMYQGNAFEMKGCDDSVGCPPLCHSFAFASGPLLCP